MNDITKKIITKLPILKKPRKITIAFIEYLKHPKKITYDSKVFFRKQKAQKIGISYFDPNFIYFNTFDKNSVVVDVGCGYEADFSKHIIYKYNAKVFAIDPTKKHRKFLKVIEEEAKGKFTHLQLAISSKNGKITFKETQDNESGSILNDHVNILKDKIKSYEVESMTLNNLPDKINSEIIDFLKLDIEGAEYELLAKVTKDNLKPFKQIFIEFHHNAIKSYSLSDTKTIVKSICEKGFNYFTLDDVNYLFYNLKYFKNNNISK
ncbi:MAG: FkbM family methyltransferase [Candidatus Marinimicrobia bacterium]|nr:FkbM family methyltransferase [Candidatus Neomarinimicrobiota bacterium]